MADAPTVNGLRTVSARLLHPWRGAWVIDAELDPDVVAQAPSIGPAVVVLGGQTLRGTVDPRGSGSFVSKASVRVVAGGGGWDKPVPPLAYHLDNGVLTTAVYNGAAALVKEIVADPMPRNLGSDYVRAAGPASQVFGDRDWYVDLQGTTQATTRLPSTPDPSTTITYWDDIEQRAELTSDALIMPGAVLTDPRFNGATHSVRDVEQTFDAQGSRVIAWCSTSSVTRLVSALTNAVRALGRTATLKVYEYRVVLQGIDGRLTLQAVQPDAGMPDVPMVRVWPGVPGDSAKFQPGSLVLLHFVEGPGGLPPQPVIVGCDPTALPLERTADASVGLHLGPTAPRVDLAGGQTPLVLAPWATGLATALSGLASSLAGFTTGPLAPLGAIGAALQAALGALPSPATVKTVAA